MSRPLTADEFGRLLAGVRHTAFRLELQPVYREPTEADSVAAFLAGQPGNPMDIPGATEWWQAVSALVAGGGRVERVRVQEDPPTDYQMWERWLDKAFNRQAGEQIRYMGRGQAHACGLLPAAGDVDWWLLDSSQLVRMWFDGHGNRIRTELTTDPAAVVQANVWRDLAVHHSAPLVAHCLGGRTT